MHIISHSVKISLIKLAQNHLASKCILQLSLDIKRKILAAFCFCIFFIYPLIVDQKVKYYYARPEVFTYHYHNLGATFGPTCCRCCIHIDLPMRQGREQILYPQDPNCVLDQRRCARRLGPTSLYRIPLPSGPLETTYLDQARLDYTSLQIMNKICNFK